MYGPHQNLLYWCPVHAPLPMGYWLGRAALLTGRRLAFKQKARHNGRAFHASRCHQRVNGAQSGSPAKSMRSGHSTAL